MKHELKHGHDGRMNWPCEGRASREVPVNACSLIYCPLETGTLVVMARVQKAMWPHHYAGELYLCCLAAAAFRDLHALKHGLDSRAAGQQYAVWRLERCRKDAALPLIARAAHATMLRACASDC